MRKKVWYRIEQWFKQKKLRFLQKSLELVPVGSDSIEKEVIKRILVVRQHDQLGDFLLSTPVFRALKARFPSVAIVLVVRNYTASLARFNPYIDEVIPFYEHGRDWTLRKLIIFVRRLRSGFDLAVVLNTVSHSLTSDLIARMSGAKYILGSEHKKFAGTQRNFCYNLIARYRSDKRHQTERNLDIVRFVGADTADTSELVTVTEHERLWAMNYFKSLGREESRPLVAIHPGAGKHGNRWAVENFAGVGRELVRTNGVQLFVTWGPREGDLGQTLLSLLEPPVLSATHSDLRKVAALLCQAQLFLCNDTGVMHLAASVGTPLVAIFGPTDPDLWKPLGEKFMAIRGEDHTCDTVTQEQVLKCAYDALRMFSVKMPRKH